MRSTWHTTKLDFVNDTANADKLDQLHVIHVCLCYALDSVIKKNIHFNPVELFYPIALSFIARQQVSKMNGSLIIDKEPS